VAVFIIGVSWSVNAVSQTRGLSGVVELDSGIAFGDFRLEITVNNHSFVVIPPSFTIIRPITSSESVEVTMFEGDRLVEYSVNDILLDPVDYTVQIRCLGCSEFVPLQYYSPDGNRFGFSNSVYIDPEDLPEELALTAISRAVIEGTISLQKLPTRDLKFALSVVRDSDPSFVYQVGPVVTLLRGATSVDYEIAGLNRNVSNNQFRVQLRCINCFGPSARAQLSTAALSPLENHSDVNFQLMGEGSFAIGSMIELLTSDQAD